MPEWYPFLKGHGTENDFVLLPDHDGTVHGDLDADRVRALCDRHAGIGGDGVLRVVRTSSYYAGVGQHADWFMDYRNSDGSVSEMCGNGIRVFAQHLVEEGLADPTAPIPIGTRDGVKLVSFADGLISVEMGVPKVLGSTTVTVGEATFPAVHVDLGNPHAVVFVDTLDPHGPVGPLLDEPGYDHAVYPNGVNVEFVVRLDPGDAPEQRIAMRVHERGSGETRSCGTGACAAAVAVAHVDGLEVPRGGASTCRVEVPGGAVTVTLSGDRMPVLLSGPAVIVATGTTDL
jgi:diaminopimelate epimerase